MGEIDLSLKVTGHALVVGKFPTIVIGDGMHPVLMRHEPLRDSVSNRLSGLVTHRTNDGIAGLALGQCHQSTPMALADHGISLPVPETAFAIDDGRALINRYLVGDDATPVIGPIALAPELLTAQEPVQLTA